MKPITKSKTMWAALGITVLGVWDQVSPIIPAEWYAKIITVIGPIVGILRLLTNSPLKGGVKPKDD